MVSTPILFLGPVRAGKTTLARSVAAQLDLPRVSLDDIRWKYYREIGYRDDLAHQIRAQGGFLALMFYRQLFDVYSVERVISEYPGAVIDFGAGVGPYESAEHLQSIRNLLAPFANIFLILPSPDREECLRILRDRDPNPPADLYFELNAHFLQHPGYKMLAKHTVYNEGKALPNPVQRS